MMLERRVVYEAWEHLEKLNPDIPIHWVWGEASGRTGGAAMQQQTSWRRARGKGRDTNEVFKSVGHLIPQEAPEALASSIFRCLERLHFDESRFNVAGQKVKL
jgi:pimeloyl-ACP methyl ester carboxylesterase